MVGIITHIPELTAAFLCSSTFRRARKGRESRSARPERDSVGQSEKSRDRDVLVEVRPVNGVTLAVDLEITAVQC